MNVPATSAASSPRPDRRSKSESEFIVDERVGPVDGFVG